MDELSDPGANMKKVVEENWRLRGKIEGYKSMENLLRKKVEEVNALKVQLTQHEKLHIQGGNSLLNSLKSESGRVEIDNSSVEIQHSSVPSQQLHTRSEESSAFSLELGFPFQARPMPVSTSPEVKKIKTYQTGMKNESRTPDVTSNQRKCMEVPKVAEVSCGDNEMGPADSVVLDSGNQVFSSTVDSLGPQIFAMANKVRYLEKKLKLTVMEKDALSDRLNELMATEVQRVRESQIMEPSNSEGRLDRGSYGHCTNVKDLENSYIFVGPDVDVDVTEPEQELISFDRPVHVENTGIGNLKSDRNCGSRDGGDVNNAGFTEDEFSKLKVKYHKQQKEFQRIIVSYREKLEHERACKENVSRQLETEKQKRLQLKEFVKRLESRLPMRRSGDVDGARNQFDKNNSREQYGRDNKNCDDKVVPDLLMEISVLHQQMVVVVEDFEKERSDRARAMSARDTLKKNFDGLAEKVKVLKRQLVTAHANLTEQISRNASLEADISRLRLVLRETNQRKIHSAPITSRRTHNVARPDIAVEFLNFWQNSNTNTNGDVEIAMTTPQGVWSCDACTYENPARRTICEICGTVNRTNISSSSPVTGTPYNDYHGYLHPIERTCRLVSRGLSTDETVTGHLDDEIDLVDTNRSHSM